MKKSGGWSEMGKWFGRKSRHRTKVPGETDPLSSFHKHWLVDNLLTAFFSFCWSFFVSLSLSLFFFFKLWGLGQTCKVKRKQYHLEASLAPDCENVGGCLLVHLWWLWHTFQVPVYHWCLFSTVCHRKHLSSILNPQSQSQYFPRVLAFILLAQLRDKALLL